MHFPYILFLILETIDTPIKCLDSAEFSKEVTPVMPQLRWLPWVHPEDVKFKNKTVVTPHVLHGIYLVYLFVS